MCACRYEHPVHQEGVPPPGPGGKIIMELVTKQKEMAEREEIIMVREFQRDLAYNMKKARPPSPGSARGMLFRGCQLTLL